MVIREKSITSQGRMSGESGCPNSPVSLVLAKLAASHIREEMKNPHQVTVYDPACGVMESSLRLAESVISNDSGVTQLMLHCSDIHPEAIRNAARRLVLRNLPNTVFVERSRKSATTRKFFITRERDVLLVSVGKVKAVVDRSGGHRISRNVTVIRFEDSSWNPEYVAMMTEGLWNEHLMEGPVIPRVRPAQLEIPAFRWNSRSVSSRTLAPWRRCASRRICMGQQLDTLANAARYGACVDIV